jgi:hypothetical protein
MLISAPYPLTAFHDPTDGVAARLVCLEKPLTTRVTFAPQRLPISMELVSALG